MSGVVISKLEKKFANNFPFYRQILFIFYRTTSLYGLLNLYLRLAR